MSREAPDWVKRLAPYVIAISFIIAGAAFVAAVPPPDYVSGFYVGFAAAVSVATWLILGTDEIPRRTEKHRRRRALRRVGLLLFLVALGLAVYLDVPFYIGPSFGWVLVTAGVKIGGIPFRERLARCARCENTRWFIRDGGKYYCPRCGERLQPEA